MLCQKITKSAKFLIKNQAFKLSKTEFYSKNKIISTQNILKK